MLPVGLASTSKPGLLPPPPLPESQSNHFVKVDHPRGRVRTLASLVELTLPFALRLKELRASTLHHLSQWQALLFVRDWIKSARPHAQFYAGGGYRLLKQAEQRLETLLGRTEHPRVLAGILGAWVLVGTINIVMHESPADAQLASYGPPHSQVTVNSVVPAESNRQSRGKEVLIERSNRRNGSGLKHRQAPAI
jgi:hypothetical protein